MWRSFALLALALSLVLLPLAGRPAAAQPDARCFPETGLCIAGPIRAYWEANGGLPVFGYPTTEQRFETVEGRGLFVQWFERDRLEIQQEGFVTAGRLGARLLELHGTPWEALPRTSSRPPDCDRFALTGHTLCPPFRAFWLANGGLERFGYPITQPFEEAIDGTPYLVQYFERRRMELHPELPGSPILLGLLGNEVRDAPTPRACAHQVVAGLEPRLAAGTSERVRLGCPTSEIYTTVDLANAAEEYFERGVMLYLRPPGEVQGRIYVIKGIPLPVVYTTYADAWSEGQPETGNATPPPGRYEPKRGFGKLWREQPGVRAALGWATQPERLEQITYQRFENGEVLWLRVANFGYVLFGNGEVSASPQFEYQARGRISFLRGTPQASDIYLVDPSGERLVNVTRGGGSRNELPAWSPDGRRLAFVSDRAGGTDLFAVDADATNLVNLTNHPALDTAPAWSPDGTRIVFASNRDGNDELYLMDADGTNLVRLTDHITTDSFPAWSPDGTQIAFWSFRAGAPDIFLISADGAGLRNLTNTPAIEFLPQWSPDGSRLAMLANSGASPRNDLAVVDATGANYRLLSPPALSVESFAWSPDGMEIVFAARQRGAADLFVVRLDDLSLRQLTGTPMANETSPSWGPGGERIAFVSDRNGGANIYTTWFLSAEVVEQVTRSGDTSELRWIR
jgi:Tol biopolymer transport system component